MVNVSTGWREQRARLAADVAQLSSLEQVARDPRVAQAPLTSQVGQDATTRTMACPVCKALYTPAPAHQQLVLAPHIVLESAFMSMCHFCFRCRRAACPDCWDAVHGVCGACVAEAQLPFRTQVKPLSNAMPPLPQQQQVVGTMHAAPVLVCIQHGRFYVKPGKDDGRPQGATPPHYPSPVPTMSDLSPRDRHSRDGGGAEGRWGPLRASVVPRDGRDRASPLRASVVPRDGRDRASPLRASVVPRSGRDRGNPLRASVVPPSRGGRDRGSPLRASVVPPSWWITEAVGGIKQWVTEALGDIEQWVTGALLVLLLTIVTMIVLAEASPSANAQIMHVLQIDIRSEVAYLIHLIGQL